MKESLAVEERMRQWGPDFLALTELASFIEEGIDPEWLLGASFHELRLRLGHDRGEAVGAAIELGRRMAEANGPREELSHPDAVGRWAGPRLAHLRHEELWILATDARGGLLSARKIAQGSVHGLSVRIADILRHAVREGAVGFVLVHNHPAGDPMPSPEDIQLTSKVAHAADILGIALLDHVVVARSAFYSILTRVRRDIEERTHIGSLDSGAAPRGDSSSAPGPSPVAPRRRPIRRP